MSGAALTQARHPGHASDVRPSPQLRSSRLLGPVVTMADYPALDHPNISDLRRRAALVIKNFDRLAAHDPPDGEWTLQDEEQSAESADAWRVALGTLRTVLVEIEGGFATARFVREVRKHAKDVAPRLESSLAAAREALRQQRAWAAIMAGDDDDARLAVEVIPAPPAEGTAPRRGPSVAFEW